MFKHFATFSLIGKGAFISSHAILSLKHPVSFNRNTWQLIFSSFTSTSTANCIFTILQSRGKEKQIRKIFYLSAELCTIMKHYSLNIENFMASIISVVKGTKVLLILKECRTVKTISHFDSCYEDYYQMLCLFD